MVNDGFSFNFLANWANYRQIQSSRFLKGSGDEHGFIATKTSNKRNKNRIKKNTSHDNQTVHQHFHIKSDSCNIFCLYIYIYYTFVAYVINDTGYGGGPPKAVRHGRPQDETDRNLQKKNMFVMCS